MAQLLLGPVQRAVDRSSATVWVETDRAAEVEVLGHGARTFQVRGHHYALVVVEDLAPGTAYRYDVRVGGEVVWPPPGDPLPPPVIRTRPDGVDGPVRIAFGSCRAAAPHRPPWTLPRDRHRRGRGTDALAAFAIRMEHQPVEEWPDALLLLGDQVYADDASPHTRAFIRTRRDPRWPPGEEVADFEEYTRLYGEAWEEPRIRWLLSTVPTAMVFDDHDITDDWNISASWVDELRSRSWWDARISGGLVAYWVYQHLGNLPRSELEADALWAEVQDADDAGDLLHDFARRADRDTTAARWSYVRDLGPVRLLVVDSRAGRVLTPQRRDMLDPAEWRWVEDAASGGPRHLVVASSLPYILPVGIHGLEAWNEAVCDGAWGAAGSRAGERIRRAIDLEHWSAFDGSFRRFARLLGEVASGRRGPAPDTVTLVSGDVHHSYVADIALPDATGSRVAQVVSSPMRQSLAPALRAAYRLAASPAGAAIGTALRWSAGVPPPPLRWTISDGPWFRNIVSILEFDGADVRLRFEAAAGVGRTTEDPPEAELVLERSL